MLYKERHHRPSYVPPLVCDIRTEGLRDYSILDTSIQADFLRINIRETNKAIELRFCIHIYLCLNSNTPNFYKSFY